MANEKVVREADPKQLEKTTLADQETENFIRLLIDLHFLYSTARISCIATREDITPLTEAKKRLEDYLKKDPIWETVKMKVESARLFSPS